MYKNSPIHSFSLLPIRAGVLAAAASLTFATELSAFSGGNGTEECPYLVTRSDTTLDGGSSAGKCYYTIPNEEIPWSRVFMAYLGYRNTGNVLLFSGPDSEASLDASFLMIGQKAGSEGEVVVRDGAALDCSAGLYVGSSGSGCVTVTGEGSFLGQHNPLLLGSSGGTGIVTVENGALFAFFSAPGDLDADGANSCLRLANGFFALPGDWRGTADLNRLTGYFRIWDGTEWTAASADNLGVTYYDTFASGDALGLYASYRSRTSLAGFTILHGGVARVLPTGTHSGASWNTAWADVEESAGGWFKSVWLGWFYTEQDFSGWIWHERHGWQYVVSPGEGQAYLYDCATGHWWFTGVDFYPFLYDCTLSTWLYYKDGAAPNREFWNYATGRLSSEADL